MIGIVMIKNAWDAVMDESKNSLRTYSLMTAHMLMQILAWMWSAIFSIALGSYLVFGVTALAHTLLVAGIVVTLLVFRRAEERSAAPTIN